MRAFLSYKFGDDITTIQRLLHEMGIEIFDSLSDLQYGSSLQKTVKNAIKKCDFLVLIYSKDNPHIAFEAGLAVATNKPIFSILNGDSTYIHASPNEEEKIKFSLEVFLKNLVPQKHSRTAIGGVQSNAFYGGREAVPTKNYFNVVTRYQSINNEKEFEVFFDDLFKSYNVRAVKGVKIGYEGSMFIPDFCIWSDELSPILGNPIVVEVKRVIRKTHLNSLTNFIKSILENNSANSVLIFYDSLSGIALKDLPVSPNKLFIDLNSFVHELDTKGFASSIKKIRNDIVHNFRYG